MSDSTTTETRDGWHEHAINACDKMHEAHLELVRAEHHLERDWAGRLTVPIEKLKRLCGKTLRLVGSIKSTREAALAAQAERAGSEPS